MLFSMMNGCINEKSEENNYPYYKFELTIYSNKNTNYQIICPIVKNIDNDEISPIMNEIELKSGSAETRINETEFGYGLFINGYGNITLAIENKKEIPYGWFNLIKGENNNKPGFKLFWIYLNSSDSILLNLKEYCLIHHGQDKGGVYESTIETKLLDIGWQGVDGELKKSQK